MNLTALWAICGLVFLLPLAWYLGWRKALTRQPQTPAQAADLHDETASALAQVHLVQAHQQALMNSIDDLAWLKDKDCRFLVVNRKFGEIFHVAPEDLVGKNDFDLSPPELAAHYQEDDRKVMAQRTPIRVEEQIHRTNGEVGWAETVKVPVFGADGSVIGTAGIARDITVRKYYERQVEFLAYHDPLTGLFNRRYLESQFDAFVRTHPNFVALFLDLDNFKMINDTDGHSVGDELLRILALRLRATTGADDILVRLGGDEFLLLKSMEDMDVTAIDMLAMQIEDSIGSPCMIGGSKYVVSSSIGIASYPQHGRDRQTLVKHADIAMYEAKKSGRHRYCWFHDSLARDTAQRRSIELRIREALESGGFELHYQPVCATLSGRVIGAEALLRLSDANGHPIPPTIFIPVAEQGGLIEPVGEWVVRTGLRHLAHWRALGHTELVLAINISGIQFASPGFVERLQDWIAEARVPGNALELELTEGVLMADVEGALATLSRIRALGVRLAVDDFGTGYSSLSYLKHLPIHRLKIDRTFVDGLPGNPGDTAITRSILQLAATFQLAVTAEGVETAQQLDFLREAGCGAVQGYFLSRPRPMRDFEGLLESGKALG